MNIALRTPNWIGDCIMSLSALKLLKDHYPNSKIFIFTKSHLKNIYVNLEEVHKILIIDHEYKRILKLRKELKNILFDYGILFTNSFSSAFLFKMLGINNLIGYKNEFRGIFLKKKLRFSDSQFHYITSYNRIVSVLTKSIPDNPTYKLAPKFTAEENKDVELLLKSKKISGNFFCLSPFAAFGRSKEWPYFHNLIDHLKKKYPKYAIIILGGRSDRQAAADLMNKSGTIKGLYSFAGELKLRDSMIVISKSHLFISNDSGLMHVAASLNIRTVAIFGSTPYLRTRPLNKSSRYIIKKIECSPCKYRECPREHECMTAISANDIMLMVDELLVG
jgi:heptosyltransferase-2